MAPFDWYQFGVGMVMAIALAALSFASIRGEERIRRLEDEVRKLKGVDEDN